MAKLKILKTVVTDTEVRLKLADHPDPGQATIRLSCRVHRPPAAPDQKRDRKALVGVQIEALQILRDAIDDEISNL